MVRIGRNILISLNFKSIESLFYALVIGSSKSVKNEANKVVLTDIPLEMFQYKFLMNPVRLAIIKMLYVYEKLTSVQIKTSLEISWSDYHTNIRALQSKSYVSVKEEFDEEQLRQFVYIEKNGRQDYQSLVKLLQQFSNDPLSLDITQIKDGDEDLYPKTN